MHLPVPHWIARLGSHVCDALHATPFSFGHLQLMQHDNLPRANALPRLLSRRSIGIAESAAIHTVSV